MKRGDKVIIKDIFDPDSYDSSKEQSIGHVFVLYENPHISHYRHDTYAAYLKPVKEITIDGYTYGPNRDVLLYVNNALLVPYKNNLNTNIRVI